MKNLLLQVFYDIISKEYRGKRGITLQYTRINEDIILKNVENFDLDETFECGQCFRWRKIDIGEYIGVVRDKVLKIKKVENNVILKETSEEDFKNLWTDYFDLKLNYGDVKLELSKINKTLKKACNFAPGIRILKQDPWETLCSFIISQNNNIPRIKGIIERLCRKYGEHLFDDFYSFPEAKVIAGLKLEDLAFLKCGFRDKYILDAAKKVVSGEVNLNLISNMEIDKARFELMKINGVGPKVAECVLLYGMHRLESFPADVWIKKAMDKLFPKYKPSDFGKFAGIAQQYIYHYVRMNKELFN